LSSSSVNPTLGQEKMPYYEEPKTWGRSPTCLPF
jgi:hypothetical protein